MESRIVGGLLYCNSSKSFLEYLFELHIRSHGDVLITFAGDVPETSVGDVPWRYIWGRPQEVALTSVEDVLRTSVGDVPWRYTEDHMKTSVGRLLGTSSRNVILPSG